MTRASAKSERASVSPQGKGRRSRRAPESTRELLERLLVRPISMKVDGAPTSVTVFDAIIFQMIQKGISGDPQAVRALTDFEESIRRRAARPTVTRFVDSDYTRAVARDPAGGGNGEI